MSVIRYGKDIPSFVKKLREEKGWSQVDLAGYLKVHGQYVSNVERGVAANPIAFCSLLYALLDKGRADYLSDLIAEAGSLRALSKVKRYRKK